MRFLFSIVTLFLCCFCGCHRYLEITVIDDQTNQPIPGAIAYNQQYLNHSKSPENIFYEANDDGIITIKDPCIIFVGAEDYRIESIPESSVGSYILKLKKLNAKYYFVFKEGT